MSETLNGNFTTDAHYSSEIKVTKPKYVAVDGPAILPSAHVFSDINASKRLECINTDIFEGTSNNKKQKKKNSIDKIIKKEKSKNEFDCSLYFKIFGGIALVAIIIACKDKFRNWFR